MFEACLRLVSNHDFCFTVTALPHHPSGTLYKMMTCFSSSDNRSKLMFLPKFMRPHGEETRVPLPDIALILQLGYTVHSMMPTFLITLVSLMIIMKMNMRLLF